MVVHHQKYGDGLVSSIDDKYIEIDFDGCVKKFRFPQAFDKFLVTQDADLLGKIESARKVVANAAPAIPTPMPARRPVETVYRRGMTVRHYNDENSANQLLGSRAQTIPIVSESEMFEIVGYMARPGRVGSFEAEVPKDGRDEMFEKMFPNQTYRPIEAGNTPSGMPNKVGTQFRINFTDISNCPDVLKKNLGKGNGRCVGRMNKSRFVLELVQNYGFRFGDRQDIRAIKDIAVKRGFEQDFNRGYSR